MKRKKRDLIRVLPNLGQEELWSCGLSRRTLLKPDKSCDPEFPPEHGAWTQFRLAINSRQSPRHPSPLPPRRRPICRPTTEPIHSYTSHRPNV